MGSTRRGFLGALAGLPFLRFAPRFHLDYRVAAALPSRERYAVEASLRRAQLYDKNRQWVVRVGGTDEEPEWGVRP